MQLMRFSLFLGRQIWSLEIRQMPTHHPRYHRFLWRFAPHCGFNSLTFCTFLTLTIRYEITLNPHITDRCLSSTDAWKHKHSGFFSVQHHAETLKWRQISRGNLRNLLNKNCKLSLAKCNCRTQPETDPAILSAAVTAQSGVSGRSFWWQTYLLVCI